MALIVELIYTERRKGLGQSEDDLVRMCGELWTKEGVQVAFHDPTRPCDDWFRPLTKETSERRHYSSSDKPKHADIT